MNALKGLHDSIVLAKTEDYTRQLYGPRQATGFFLM